MYKLILHRQIIIHQNNTYTMASKSAHFCWSTSSSPSPSPISSSSTTSSLSSSISSPTTIKTTKTTLTADFFKQTPIGAQISNHTLLQLQKEIKEEEDEIFADIDSLLNSRTLEEFDDETRNGDDLVKYNKDEQGIRVPHENTNDDLKRNFEYIRDDYGSTHEYDENISKYEIKNDYDHHEDLNEEKENVNEKEKEQEQIEEKKQLEIDETDVYVNKQNNYDYEYDDYDYEEGVGKENVEDHLENNTIPETLQVIIKQVTSNLPKPCVFFLEGNCRRSDCKFSHDLSSIPCKYWIEGFCFKGEMCPFSHDISNVPHLIDPDDPNSGLLLDEDGRPLSPFSASKREQQLNPTFVIESEADFPSLPLEVTTNVSQNDNSKSDITNQDAIANTIRNQILSSNAAVVFKTVKRKRRKA